MMRGIIACVALVCATSVGAQTAVSVTTRLDLKKCAHTSSKEVEDYGRWRCKGYGGMPVIVTAGDSRSYVSFGPKARGELAMRETLASFNGAGSKIEWRGEAAKGGRIKPYATIMRWSTVVTGQDDKITEGEVIVVTRLGPGGVCHVAYADTKANRDADALARKAADENARAFRCGSDKPAVLGEIGPGFSRPYND